jgi:hypothetical protein
MSDQEIFMKIFIAGIVLLLVAGGFKTLSETYTSDTNIVFALFAAWITHIIFCLGAGAWGFLIAGALVFPIAIIHGVGLWFGVF